MPVRFVVSALNFFFCAPPESFKVKNEAPFIFTSFAASNSVKSHLVRIGVFASEGIIFHIHGDRPAARRDVPPETLQEGHSDM